MIEYLYYLFNLFMRQNTSRLLRKPGNGPKRHTGRDEIEIRYLQQTIIFFWIPDSRFAPSGMTDLVLALKILSFPSACYGLGTCFVLHFDEVTI